MRLFLTLLLNVIVLIFPYIIPLLKLNDCAWRRNTTLKTIINKYDDAKSLLWFVLGFQFGSIVLSIVSIVICVFVLHENVNSLAGGLFIFAMNVIITESIFGLPIIWTVTNGAVDYINSDLLNPQNQSIKI